MHQYETPAAEPLERFHALLAMARSVGDERLPEPTAFCLATVGENGQPSARMLLLKDADARGFVFYTNLLSRKARELAGNDRAAMCFHWQPLERQVRVEGRVVPVDPAEADAYFASRARISQIGAWASSQSDVIPPGETLEARVRAAEERFAGKPVPRPAHWSGFRLVPDEMEFWVNGVGRLHLRHRYTRQDGGWRVDTLFP